MVAAKVANVGVPLLLKTWWTRMVDLQACATANHQAVLVVPVALVVAYGAAAPVDLAVHRTA
jgi:hypothetical protein